MRHAAFRTVRAGSPSWSPQERGIVRTFQVLLSPPIFAGSSTVSNRFLIMVQACIVGIITGCGAIGYDALIHLVQGVALEFGRPSAPSCCPSCPGIVFCWFPPSADWRSGWSLFFGPRDAQGHGVPEVIESVALGNGKFRWQTALTKSVSSALTIGSGGSVGREGPIVHIGASLGSVLGQLAQSARPIACRPWPAVGSPAALPRLLMRRLPGPFLRLRW